MPKSNDAISIRFSFLECGHSNELPQPHASLKNTWIASTSLCTPPTIAAVVRLMRHFYSALFPLAPPKEEGIDLLFCGAHTTQAGFPFVISLSSVNWLRRSFGLSRATDQSGLPMTWLVPCFVPLLLAAERSVGRYKSDSWSHSHRFAVACDL